MSLRLRMLGLENTSELFLLIEKNREYLERWFEWTHDIKSEQECLNFIEQCNQKYQSSKAFDLGIWLDDDLIGMIGFYEINWTHRHAEISYWITQEQQGKGYVRQCVQAMMTYAFKEYNLNRIEILCALDNLRSRSVAEKLGFTFEGVKREDFQFMGRFFDEACYSFLARDFHVTGEEPYAQLARQICTP
ncbi:MAG: GNAT family protein [Myxococcaceae bacterium]